MTEPVDEPDLSVRRAVETLSKAGTLRPGMDLADAMLLVRTSLPVAHADKVLYEADPQSIRVLFSQLKEIENHSAKAAWHIQRLRERLADSCGERSPRLTDPQSLMIPIMVVMPFEITKEVGREVAYNIVEAQKNLERIADVARQRKSGIRPANNIAKAGDSRFVEALVYLWIALTDQRPASGHDLMGTPFHDFVTELMGADPARDLSHQIKLAIEGLDPQRVARAKILDVTPWWSWAGEKGGEEGR